MSDYSATDRLLHRLALGPLAEITHDIERARFLKAAPSAEGSHVFVTGLARSGTTVLMREIYATGKFGSLTYADMPFVLAPNSWARFARRASRRAGLAERAHGDGIMVGYDSPEALDEVYWRVADGAAYIKADHLLPHRPSKDLIDGYVAFLRLVMLARKTTRYLSKNNNNILRLLPLSRALPRSTFLISLRDPLQHVRSLLSMHERFLSADRFTQDYMTWLAHHEFGATHRRFRFGGVAVGDPMTLDYWLRLWIEVHGALAAVEETQSNVAFVPHEGIARDATVWRMVARRIEVAAHPLREIRPVAARDPGAHDATLADTALALHRRLTERARLKLVL